MAQSGATTAVAEPLRRSRRGWVGQVLTISKLKRWSINYYIDTARAGRDR